MNVSEIIGIAGILIGIGASYYFYRISRRAKEPCWSIRSNNLIRGYETRIADLEIRYKGQRVENLTASRILFWNDGAETIYRQDITDVDPLRIAPADGVRLLDVRLLLQNNRANLLQCDLSESDGIARIQFDYLGQGDGGVIGVFHTGTSLKDIQVKGIVKGAKALTGKYAGDLRGRRLLGRKLSFTASRNMNFLSNLLLPVLSTLMGILILSERAKSLIRDDLYYFGVFFVITGSLLGILIVIERFTRLRRISPQSLEAFADDMSF